MMTKTDILLVEPNENLAQPVLGVLENAGYSTKHSRTGRSALLQERACITLVSSNLPDMCCA
ncbi:hypothetical protein OGZ01_23380 [Vibrio harveyi]|nr:hypothetical protein [Vibrio harveyi]